MKRTAVMGIIAGMVASSLSASAFAEMIPYKIISQGNQVSCVAETKSNRASVCDIHFHAINPYANYDYHTTTQTLSAKTGGQSWHVTILANGSQKVLCESFPHSLFGAPKIQSFQYCENPQNNYIKTDYLFSYPDHRGTITASEKMHVNLVGDGSAEIHFIDTELSRKA